MADLLPDPVGVPGGMPASTSVDASADEDLDRFQVRVGTDLQPVDEVADALRRYGDRYRGRLFTEHEVACCGGPDADPDAQAPGLTARFAAKEAVIKMLRPTDRIPAWREIEVRRVGHGWTEVQLSGTAAELAADQCLCSTSLSLSHGAGIGLATVIGTFRRSA